MNIPYCAKFYTAHYHLDLYLSLVFIASIISPLSHFGCCLRLTRCCFKGKCLSIISKNKEDQLSTISFVSSNILITSQGVEDKSLINSVSLKFLKDLCYNVCRYGHGSNFFETLVSFFQQSKLWKKYI